jgi:hypothetical protein
MRCASMQPRGFKACSMGTSWPQRRDTRMRNWASRLCAPRSQLRLMLGVRAEKVCLDTGSRRQQPHMPVNKKMLRALTV